MIMRAFADEQTGQMCGKTIMGPLPPVVFHGSIQYHIKRGVERGGGTAQLARASSDVSTSCPSTAQTAAQWTCEDFRSLARYINVSAR